jgi:hypothetical protein
MCFGIKPIECQNFGIAFSTQTSATFAKIFVETFGMAMFWHAPILVEHICFSTNQALSTSAT